MCQAKTEQAVWTHKWEGVSNGRGEVATAPFRYVSMADMGKVDGSCDVCFTGIRYFFFIQGANGVRFKVGIDCVRKTNDAELISVVEKARRDFDKKKKDDKRKADWARREAALKAALEAERVANGGMTNDEKMAAEKEAALVVTKAKFTEENRWLLDVLDHHNHGDFVQCLIDKLETGPLTGLSDRMLSILKDIYAKHFGRSGSTKYNTAADFFVDKIEPV
jgi:hypothetical protein